MLTHPRRLVPPAVSGGPVFLVIHAEVTPDAAEVPWDCVVEPRGHLRDLFHGVVRVHSIGRDSTGETTRETVTGVDQVLLVVVAAH